MPERKPLRSYGRVKGRTIKPRQAALLETLLPRIAIPPGPIDVEALFADASAPSPLAGEGREGGRSGCGVNGDVEHNADCPSPPTPSPQGRGGHILEIGFGGGEHLVAQAAANPEARFIGVEPFVNGVASCLRHIEETDFKKRGDKPLPLEGGGEGVGVNWAFDAGHPNSEKSAHEAYLRPRRLGVDPRNITPPPTPSRGGGKYYARRLNIRLHHGDARDVLARLPAASLDRVDILFPDPWPKTRHHKRRLIQPDFIVELARVLKLGGPERGGEIRFATDWKAYAAWTLELFLKNPDFTWTAERARDWREPWPGHVATRYEQKRLGDTAPIYLRFRRLS